MIYDTARLTNDLKVVVSTLCPEADLDKLSIRFEEVLSNYETHRKTVVELENDIPEMIELYLAANKLEGHSNKTLADYRSELRLFTNHCQKAVSQVTTPDIRNYLASIKGVMMSTIGKKLTVLKSFFGWLVKEEILLRDPTAKIKQPKVPKRLKKGLSVEELELVRESCATLRQRALVEVMYSTGCRVSEVSAMDKSHIDMQAMNLRVVGKGDAERVVYLSFKALYHLNRYLESRNDNEEALFVMGRKPYRRLSSRAMQDEVNKVEQASGLTKVITPHVFRHTFATLKIDNGCEMADLQQLMGHSNPATTQIYAQVSEERKQQAFKKYHVQ